MLDLPKHFVDVGRGKGILRGRANDCELPARVASGRAPPRRAERLTDPFGHRHAPALGDSLNFLQFGFLEEDL